MLTFHTEPLKKLTIVLFSKSLCCLFFVLLKRNHAYFLALCYLNNGNIQNQNGQKDFLCLANLKKMTFWTSSQDGGVSRHTVPPPTTKRRTKTILKNKLMELTENRTVWKSDNQGVKENTLSRLVGGTETGSGWRGLMGKGMASKATAGGPGNRSCIPKVSA